MVVALLCGPTSLAPAAAAKTFAPATTAAAAASAAAKVATGALFARPGFVDCQGAAIDFLAIELGHGLVGLFLRAHFHEGKPSGAVGELVHDEFALHDAAGLFEEVEQIAFGAVE